MHRVMLKGTIHRATVTEHNLNYEGSITIDENLMDLAGIIPHKQVHIFTTATVSKPTPLPAREAQV